VTPTETRKPTVFREGTWSEVRPGTRVLLGEVQWDDGEPSYDPADMVEVTAVRPFYSPAFVYEGEVYPDRHYVDVTFVPPHGSAAPDAYAPVYGEFPDDDEECMGCSATIRRAGEPYMAGVDEARFLCPVCAAEGGA